MDVPEFASDLASFYDEESMRTGDSLTRKDLTEPSSSSFYLLERCGDGEFKLVNFFKHNVQDMLSRMHKQPNGPNASMKRLQKKVKFSVPDDLALKEHQFNLCEMPTNLSKYMLIELKHKKDGHIQHLLRGGTDFENNWQDILINFRKSEATPIDMERAYEFKSKLEGTLYKDDS